MIKTITKIGNSQGIILDAALMQSAKLQPGDELNITFHEGGSIILTPVRPRLGDKEVSKVIGKTIKDYRKTLRRLA